MSAPELLTIAAAARRLGRSWAWTLDAATRGDLPGVRIGRRWYVRNLTAFLDAAQTAPQRRTTAAVSSSRAEECARLGIESVHEFS